MSATDFEYHHQTLVHQLIVALAFLTYVLNRDDVVWHFIKDSNAPRVLEHSLFAVATLLIAVGAGICTWSRAYSVPDGATGQLLRRQYLGDLFYAIGLGSLAPLWGFVILVVGETLRVFRLMQRENARAQNSQTRPSPTSQPLAAPVVEELHPKWGRALRQEAVKWGLVLTMIVFVITLKDRLAELLAAASFLIGLLLNAPLFSHLPRVGEST